MGKERGPGAREVRENKKRKGNPFKRKPCQGEKAPKKWSTDGSLSTLLQRRNDIIGTKGA